MLAAVADTSGSVILGLDERGRIFAWNRAAAQLYQTPRETALGLDYVDTFIAPEHRAPVKADIAEVLEGKRTLNFEDDSILPDGRRRTLIWNVSRILDRGGKPVGIVATGQDITERKEAESRFRLIFEHAQDGMLLSDSTGVLDCNPAALALLGLTDKAELIGRRPAEFSPAVQPDGAESDPRSRELGALALDRGSLTFDWVHSRPDGSPVPVEVSVQHAQLEGRRVSIVVWRDQSRRRELERERADMERRLHLAQKMEAVGQLAAGVAHDFNNLLAAIRNSIQLALLEPIESTQAREDLDVALRTREQAAGLTGQLLAFGRQQPRRQEPVDLAKLVTEVLPLLRSSLSATITICQDIPTGPAYVMGDRSQLTQVVLNLVLNARDAMSSGGTLTVSVRPDGEDICMSVSDTGNGIPAELRERIFEPFFTTKSVGSGTGLGLAVVYGVVTQAGGTVSVDSTVGRGTTIAVSLPGHVAPVRTDPVEPRDSQRVVLLVDDDDMVRTTTRRLLEHSGFEVVAARNGHDAIAQFHDVGGLIDIVVSDVRMPGINGLQLVEQLRALAPMIPALLISGYDDISPEQLAGLPDVALLAKPFAAARLIAEINRLVVRD